MNKIVTILDGDSEDGIREVTVTTPDDIKYLKAYAKKHNLKGLKIDESTVTRETYKPSAIFRTESGDPVYIKQSPTPEHKVRSKR